jgi:hypothetical protein
MNFLLEPFKSFRQISSANAIPNVFPSISISQHSIRLNLINLNLFTVRDCLIEHLELKHCEREGDETDKVSFL